MLAGLMVIIFAGALILRGVLPCSQVFTSNGVIFTGNDAYYHMRLIVNFVHNFPHFPNFDPYFLYPGNPSSVGSSFFEWLIGVIVWIAGLGSPSQHTIDAIAAWIPAIMGALTVIPVFFIGKELWGKHGRWAGLVAAALIAVLPGEFLGRSILGFTDQHVAETLFSTTAILFLIMAIKSARQRELSFGDISHPKWNKLGRPFLFSLLTGLFLGLYIWTWQGALLIVFTMAAYFVVQFVIDHLKGRPTAYLSIVGTVIFVVTLLFIPVSGGAVYSSLYPPALIIAALMPVVLGLISRFMDRRKMSRGLYLLAVVVLGLAGLGIFYLIKPSMARTMFDAFSIFKPTGTLLTTVEAQSILTPLRQGGGFFDTPAWLNFYLTLPFGIAALLILVGYSVLKRGNSENGVFVVWTLVMLVATIGQRRFAYYSAVNIAILAGYASILVYYLVAWVLARSGGDRTATLSAKTLDLDGFTSKAAFTVAPVDPATKKSRRRERQEARRREIERLRVSRRRTRGLGDGATYLSAGLTVVIVFLVLFGQLVLFPDQAHGLARPPTVATASGAPYATTDGWAKAMAWMKDNTPEPFGFASAYYEHFQKPADNRAFTYPSSMYGVLAWWDYGYWITYIAHRVPNANPGQEASAVQQVAAFFTSQNETAAETIAQKLTTGYVVMDDQTATSKFYAVGTWAGQDPTRYQDVYYVPQNNQLMPVALYNPEYYESMAIRLYNFDGKAVVTDNVTVISYQQNTDKASGQTFKQITDAKQFTSYADAQAFLAQQKPGTYKIVGVDPMISPVPLDALQDYQLVYSSPGTVAVPQSSKQAAEVKVFQRTTK